MSRHRSFRTTAAACALSAALLVGLPAITAAQAPTARAAASHTHRFRGTVRHTSRRHHWFSMRTSTHHTVRVHTASGTWWDDCDWGAMRYGHHVDVRAHRHHHMWVASSVHNWQDNGDMMGGGMWNR